MVYYLMTTEQMYTFYNLYRYNQGEICEARKMVEEKHATVTNASSYIEREAIPNYKRLYRAYKIELAEVTAPLYTERNQKVNELLSECVRLMSKTKKACCEEGAMISNTMGGDEYHILNVTFSKYNDFSTVPDWVNVSQYWYIYKDDGKWFQKMNKGCKAKHEITI